MLYVDPNTKKNKSCFANLFTNSETMDNGHWKCHQYWMLMLCLKGEQAYTMLFSLLPSGQGGTCYIFAQIQRKKNFFVVNQFTNSDTMGQYCIYMFFKRETALHHVFYNTGFPIRGEHKIRF